MAPAHAGLPAAVEEERAEAGELGLYRRGEAADRLGRKHLRLVAELLKRLGDDAAEGLGRRLPVADLRPGVRLEHEGGEAGDDVGGEPPALGDEVERHGLVEAPHVHGPFDDLAVAAEMEAAVAADDRHGAEIEVGREMAVDRHFRLADGAALLQARLVEEGEMHRPLHLVDIRPGEEDDGGMGADAADRPGKPVGRRVGEEGEDLGLVVGHGGGWQTAVGIAHILDDIGGRDHGSDQIPSRLSQRVVSRAGTCSNLGGDSLASQRPTERPR